MLLHRATLEAILADQGFPQWGLKGKLKKFLSGNAIFAGHRARLLALKERGDLLLEAEVPVVDLAYALPDFCGPAMREIGVIVSGRDQRAEDCP